MDVQCQTSRYNCNRGKPLCFINTGVSVRIKVQPTNIDRCSGYYSESRVRSSREAMLISDNYTST